MSTRSIRCRLVTTEHTALALTATCAVFARACNSILASALVHNEFNAIGLQKLVYRQVRDDFPLTANLAVRAIRRVVTALTVSAREKKPLPKKYKPTSVSYDSRIFAYREADETVSISTVHGRLHIPLKLGDYQRKALAGKRPTAAVLHRVGKQWDLNIVVEDDDASSPGDSTMGVDLGIRNTAATSFGSLHSGETRRAYKAERQRVRSSFQSKGSKGAKRALRRLSGKERNRIRHENHVLSRAIVDEAVRHECGVLRMERLKGIRQRTKVWNKHLNRMMAGWSFYELQQFVEYKARRCGIVVEYVNPAYTSQTCATCGELGERRGDVFRCTACGEFHADTNAAWNIAGGGAVVNRPVSGVDVSPMGYPKAVCFSWQ